LYLVILVPYNLFGPFLVHKILAYKYICINGKKKWENKKEKEFPTSWVGGDFGPPRRACGPVGPAVRERWRGTTGDGAVARGPHASEGGG
jgi:hypothetical protein